MEETVSEERSIALTENEACCLARLVVEKQLEDIDWIGWEDLPYLNEASMHLVAKHILLSVGEVREQRKALELRFDVDSVFLLDQAEEGIWPDD